MKLLFCENKINGYKYVVDTTVSLHNIHNITLEIFKITTGPFYLKSFQWVLCFMDSIWILISLMKLRDQEILRHLRDLYIDTLWIVSISRQF